MREFGAHSSLVNIGLGCVRVSTWQRVCQGCPLLTHEPELSVKT
jgi:hypothetical protein